MGNHVPSPRARLACVLPVLTVFALMTVGPIGCGEKAPETGTQTQLAPEAVKANNNMEDFLKTQKKKR